MNNPLLLTTEEKRTIEVALYELRMAYLENVGYFFKEAKKDKGGAGIYISMAKRNRLMAKEAVELSRKVWRL